MVISKYYTTFVHFSISLFLSPLDTSPKFKKYIMHVIRLYIASRGAAARIGTVKPTGCGFDK